MLALAVFLLATPADDLAARLRHLRSTALAQAPSPSPDGRHLAFVTTLFGSAQAAYMDVDGGYPVQLTDEPGGVEAVWYAPQDPGLVIVSALREGKRRLLLVSEEGAPAEPIDPAPGDQIYGGFARDGRKLFYAAIDNGRSTLRSFPLDTRKPAEFAAPPPAAGPQQVKSGSIPLAEAVQALVELSPPTLDGRSIAAVVKRGDAQALVLCDLPAARADLLAEGGRFRTPRFSPDQRTLYVLDDADHAGRFAVDGIALPQKQRKPLYAPGANVEAYAISGDGHRMAVVTEQEGESVFSLLELPSLRPQPLALPPAGALAPAVAPLRWNKTGDRIFFAWGMPDDTQDVWSQRLGYGAALRLTHSAHPELKREELVRPRLVQRDPMIWEWRPENATRTVVVRAAREVRPVFDPRIAALNFAGIAVRTGAGAEKTDAVIDLDRYDRNELEALIKAASH